MSELITMVWFRAVLLAQSENGAGEGAGKEEVVRIPEDAAAPPEWMSRFFESLSDKMPAVLQQSFLGIEYWQYLIGFACVLLGLVAKKISDYAFEHHVLPAAGKTKWQFDNLILEALYKPLGVAFALLGVFGALVALMLHVELSSMTSLIFPAVRIAFLLDFLWFVFRIVDVLAQYLARMAGRTDSKLDDQLVPVIKKSMKFFVGVLAFVMVVQHLGYSVSGLLAGLGIGGLAVAMAARETLANFFGGLVIFTDHPFRLGDWTRVGDVEGTVEQIGFRSTRVRTFPKTLVTIPNSQVVSQVVENKSKMPVRRVFTTVGVTYETTAEQMETLLEDFKEILKSDEGVDQEYIVVRFVEFGASSLDILLYFFTKPTAYAEHTEVLERINLAVMRAVEARGLSIAFPTQTVYFEGEVAKAFAGRLPPPETSRPEPPREQ